MAASKKHRPAEGALDGEEARPTKKAKTAAHSNGTAAAEDASDAGVREKKDKKKKKKKLDKGDDGEKKDKKDKEKRREKKREEAAKRLGDEQPTASNNGDANETPSATRSSSEGDSTVLGRYTYQQAIALTALPEKEIAAFRTANQIIVNDTSDQDGGSLRPILQFAHLPPSPLIAKAPFAAFSTPTPIQSASWPFSLSGRDIVGVAETGSGKTLAFAVPCVEALYASGPADSSKKGKKARSSNSGRVRAVVVSPTRELALQTHETMAALAAHVGLVSVCIYGGASKEDQRQILQRKHGVDIIVATPGRLKDFLSDGTVSLASVQFVVLDEADRMLDKGFEDDIKQILGECPGRSQRQTLMFTATWPTSVRTLAESFMVNPVKITIGGKTTSDSEDGGAGAMELRANARISQAVEVVEPRDKEWRLLRLLKEAQQGQGKKDRILVFCLYKKEASRVENFLRGKGLHVASIHGDLRQEQRTQALDSFKAGRTTVLVATDVAARGLDIPEVKLVINVTVCAQNRIDPSRPVRCDPRDAD